MQATAEAFVSALLSLDQDAIARVATDDVTWTVPGTNGRSLDVRSALALGIDGERVTTVTGFVSDVTAYEAYVE